MLKTSLQIILQSLAELAPRIVEYSLNEGATPEDFENLEMVIKNKLPDDFKELYKTHNGLNDEDNWGNFFYGMPFFSIADIITECEFRSNQSKNIALISLNTFDPQIDGSNIYNLNWLSIGSGSDCNLFVDLAPSNKGSYGQVIFIDETYRVGILVANSVSELVVNFATDLKNNLYSLNSDALEDGQHFLETDSSIDLANWFNVDKWKHLDEK